MRSRIGIGGTSMRAGNSPSQARSSLLEVSSTLLFVSRRARRKSMSSPCSGYVLRIRETDWNEHRMFKGPDTDVNLHVYTVGCPEVDRMLAFRNWLRGNEADRKLYEKTKRDLARRSWKYTQNYADAKSEVVAAIMERALNSKY
jgi:GrpB-like predicted nucleotidyltransferase (UPF0157 family)